MTKSNFQCTILLLDYLAYPTSLSMTIELQSSMQFPSVTICNMNKFRISTVEEIPDIRRVFLYELALSNFLPPIIEQLEDYKKSQTKEQTYAWCTISPQYEPDLVFTMKKGENITLDTEKKDDPSQLFMFNEITGSIVANETGFCLVEDEGVIVTRSKSCKDTANIEWSIQSDDESGVISIFNSEGKGFQVAAMLKKGQEDEDLFSGPEKAKDHDKFDYYYIAVAGQDFGDERQFFTRKCNDEQNGESFISS